MPRDYPLGFGTHEIPPLSTMDVSATPRKAFAPRRLVTLGCEGLRILSVRTSTGYLLFSGVSDDYPGGVPAEEFGPEAKPPALRVNAVPEDEPLTIVVSNPTIKRLTFRASLVGKMAPKHEVCCTAFRTFGGHSPDCRDAATVVPADRPEVTALGFNGSTVDVYRESGNDVRLAVSRDGAYLEVRIDANDARRFFRDCHKGWGDP